MKTNYLKKTARWLEAALHPSYRIMAAEHSLPSRHLKRKVKIRVLQPPAGAHRQGELPALYLNDGQDLEALDLLFTLQRLYRKGKIAPFILVAVHAGDRMQEYGTIGRPDYKKRGSRAGAYASFLTSELLPFLESRYPLQGSPAGRSIAGFSLGGLSAFDLAWHHPALFHQVGVFSGSLWWRSTPFEESRPDAGRIVQDYVEAAAHCPPLRFWLQAGTADETSDRNGNGVIDAIDDTLDLMRALQSLGCPAHSLRYVEVSGGEHRPETWGQVMPDFLQWAFPKRATKA